MEAGTEIGRDSTKTSFTLQDVNELTTSKEKGVTKKKLLIKVNKQQEKNKQKDKLIKRLKEQNRRKANKILTLMTLLNCLKQKSLINDDQANFLQSTNVTTRELCARQQKNKNKISTSKYSPALRTFALTLYYYSTKAYNYVRKIFNCSLPHPHTIHKWYKSFNGSPGFTTESLKALEFIASKSKKPLYCCLMIDEMAIRKKIEWDGKRFHGYVDFGGSLCTDEVPEAKEALVMLITGINASWKVIQIFVIYFISCNTLIVVIIFYFLLFTGPCWVFFNRWGKRSSKSRFSAAMPTTFERVKYNHSRPYF